MMERSRRVCSQPWLWSMWVEPCSPQADLTVWPGDAVGDYPICSSANLGCFFPVLMLEAVGGRHHSGRATFVCTGYRTCPVLRFRQRALKILWVLQGLTGYLLWLRLFCVAQYGSAFDSREVVCRPAMQAVSLKWNSLPMVYWTFCNDYIAAEKLKT